MKIELQSDVALRLQRLALLCGIPRETIVKRAIWRYLDELEEQFIDATERQQPKPRAGEPGQPP